MNSDVAASLSVLPHGLPQMNVLLIFGVLLAFGTLGGLLAARVRWLPTITGFMALGLVVGPSGIGLLSKESLDSARVLVDIALGLILFQLGVTLHPWIALRNSDVALETALLLPAYQAFGAIAVSVAPVGRRRARRDGFGQCRIGAACRG